MWHDVIYVRCVCVGFRPQVFVDVGGVKHRSCGWWDRLEGSFNDSIVCLSVGWNALMIVLVFLSIKEST
eukprot:m.306826 g.306826  ORF g.306826 m.306826 type:complete len:69 (+) comp20191_c1_seq59:2449-2655(+)